MLEKAVELEAQGSEATDASELLEGLAERDVRS